VSRYGNAVLCVLASRMSKCSYICYKCSGLGYNSAVNKRLSEILFKESRRKVLALLLLHPAKSFHVREIARLTGTVAGTINRELRTLAEADILIRETQSNQVHYRANTDCVIFEELASILRKTSGVADVLAEALLPLSNNIQAAFVYGSMANGRSTSASDIDLCIIGDVEYLEAVKALSDTQRILQREINPKIYSAVEWLNLTKKPSAFMAELLSTKEIRIIGTKDDIREPGR